MRLTLGRTVPVLFGLALGMDSACASPTLAELCKQGDEQSIEACTSLIELSRLERKPENQFRHWRAHGYLTAKQYQAAAEDASAVAAREPWNAHALVDRAQAMAAMGHQALAVQDAGNALALRPDRADYWYFRGNLHLKMGMINHAIRDYSECIARRPAMGLAYMNRAIARGQNGQLAEGLADANYAVRLLPSEAGAYHNRGLLHYLANNWLQAYSDFDATIRLAGSSANVIQLRADVLARLAGRNPSTTIQEGIGQDNVRRGGAAARAP